MTYIGLPLLYMYCLIALTCHVSNIHIFGKKSPYQVKTFILLNKISKEKGTQNKNLLIFKTFH